MIKHNFTNILILFVSHSKTAKEILLKSLLLNERDRSSTEIFLNSLYK